MRVRVPLLVFVTVAVASAACSQGIDLPVTHVFEAPAWAGSETLAYNLVEQGGQIYGTCELQTRPESDPGRTQLTFFCGDSDGNRDDRRALVESKSLRPYSTTRVIFKAKDNKSTTFSSEYEDKTVRLTADVDGKRSTAERDLPKPTAKSPDPGYYDDESLLWLVRGIPLHDGFKGAYKDINAGTGQVFPVEVSVDGREQVKVPAGEFTAWKVRIRTTSITQFFWVEVDAPHRVVKAHVEHLTYELTGGQ